MIATAESHAESVAGKERLLRDSRVNLLLIGFPKCGTTAFAEWLGTSSRVAVSTPKETFQLCGEFRENLVRAGSCSLQESFAAKPQAPFRLEASTLNVFSESLLQAVQTIPDVRVIVLARAPWEAVISWHNQMLHARQAKCQDFAAAWDYARSNADSSDLPLSLRYDHLCRFGYWTERWVKALGHDRVLIVESQELSQSPPSVQQRVSRFCSDSLKLAESVPVRNVYSRVRFPRLYKLLRSAPIKKTLRLMGNHLPIVNRARTYVRESIVLAPMQKAAEAGTADDLRSFFAGDQQAFKALYEQNLVYWSTS